MVAHDAELQESQDETTFSFGDGIVSEDGNQESAKSKKQDGSGGSGFGGSTFGGGFDGFRPAPKPTAHDGVWSNGIGITWSDNKDLLHGFSHATGRWATIRIEPPDQVDPTVGDHVAVVAVGSSVAAYSGATCTWDLLKLELPITSGPAIYSELVRVRTADHIYTFAAAHGKWTFPTDTSLNADSPTTTETPGNIEASLPSGHHHDGHTTAQLEEAWGHAERKTIEVPQRVQRTSSDATEKALQQLQEELRNAVESAFSARRMLQIARMNQMQSKLDQISESLQAREQRRDRIIERRVEELQDPGLDWQAIREINQTPSTVRNQPKNGPWLPLGGPAGLRSHSLRTPLRSPANTIDLPT